MDSNPQQTTPRPIVIKIGGALLADFDALGTFWADINRLRAGAPVLIVHGGGPQATTMARRLGHQPRIVHGRRVTSDLDLEIIHWSLRGALNTGLVAEATRHGLPAVGLSGVDGGTLRVSKRPPWEIDGEIVDFGWVGDIERVEPGLLRALMAAGFMPIVAPMGFDAEGQRYNVNADTVAQALAITLEAAELLIVTESGGVRRDPADPASLLTECDAATYAKGRTAGWIAGGMRVKLEVAFEALEAGISDVFILSHDHLRNRTHATKVVHNPHA